MQILKIDCWKTERLSYKLVVTVELGDVDVPVSSQDREARATSGQRSDRHGEREGVPFGTVVGDLDSEIHVGDRHLSSGARRDRSLTFSPHDVGISSRPLTARSAAPWSVPVSAEKSPRPASVAVSLTVTVAISTVFPLDGGAPDGYGKTGQKNERQEASGGNSRHAGSTFR
jgi:hypothetical protein